MGDSDEKLFCRAVRAGPNSIRDVSKRLFKSKNHPMLMLVYERASKTVDSFFHAANPPLLMS